MLYYSCTITYSTKEAGILFDIKPRSSIPIYQQLVDGVKEAIARGVLAPGERMPTVREMATQLSINPNTIAKAYQKLETEGVIETMRSRGTFVAGRTVMADSPEARAKLAGLMEKVMVEAYHMGIDSDELRQLFDDSLEKWKQGG
jgi:GntR family transcriptional regulator